MVALTEQERDVVDRFNQLPPERRRYVMLAMFGTDADGWRQHQAKGEQRLRTLAAERGFQWDLLDDDQRQDFVNALLHEGRP
jgi:hypothetical protein